MHANKKELSEDSPLSMHNNNDSTTHAAAPKSVSRRTHTHTHMHHHPHPWDDPAVAARLRSEQLPKVLPSRFVQWLPSFVVKLRLLCPTTAHHMTADDAPFGATSPWLCPVQRFVDPRTSEWLRFRWLLATHLSPMQSMMLPDNLLLSISIYDMWRIGTGGCPGCALLSAYGDAVPDVAEAHLALRVSAALQCEACFHACGGNHLLDTNAHERGMNRSGSSQERLHLRQLHDLAMECAFD